jgi:hypothetical protein
MFVLVVAVNVVAAPIGTVVGLADRDRLTPCQTTPTALDVACTLPGG